MVGFIIYCVLRIHIFNTRKHSRCVFQIIDKHWLGRHERGFLRTHKTFYIRKNYCFSSFFTKNFLWKKIDISCTLSVFWFLMDPFHMFFQVGIAPKRKWACRALERSQFQMNPIDVLFQTQLSWKGSTTLSTFMRFQFQMNWIDVNSETDLWQKRTGTIKTLERSFL